jgi:GGDEF domain-containing protein
MGAIDGQDRSSLGELRRLASTVDGLGAAVASLSQGDWEPAESDEGLSGPGLQDKLALLREALSRPDLGIAPQLSPFAGTGHAYPIADRMFGVQSGEARSGLEELAELGLLRRELHNRVHVCPKCNRCQLNFRETCQNCDSLLLHIERLIHHFACAYVGLESEFVRGIEMVCPKCRNRLHQLGQDFDRPHESYVCEGCKAITELPVVHGQCLHCTNLFPVVEARVLDIYTYYPTELTARAIELGRLTGLRVADLLFDPEVRLARLDYLMLEVRRELLRLQRHDSVLSLARLRFLVREEPFPLFQQASEREIKDLGRRLTATLRELDLAAPFDASTLCLLLPETTEDGARQVAHRIDEILGRLSLHSPEGEPVRTSWTVQSWSEPPPDLEAALAAIREGH